MPTTTMKTAKVQSRVEKTARKPLRMKSWKEAREYIRTHLTPAGYTPAGRPYFDESEILKLNILLPDEYE